MRRAAAREYADAPVLSRPLKRAPANSVFLVGNNRVRFDLMFPSTGVMNVTTANYKRQRRKVTCQHSQSIPRTTSPPTPRFPPAPTSRNRFPQRRSAGVTLSRDHGSHGLTEVHVRGFANKSHVCRTKWYELLALLIERVGVRVVPKE